MVRGLKLEQLLCHCVLMRSQLPVQVGHASGKLSAGLTGLIRILERIPAAPKMPVEWSAA